MTKKLRATLLLLTATIIWGSAFTSQNIAMDHMKPFGFQAARCFIAVLSMLPIIALTDRSKNDGSSFCKRWTDPKLWKAGLLCGVPLFLACNLQQLALVDTDAGKAGFLTAMYIVIVPIIGIFRGLRPSINIPISVLIAAVGLYFLSCGDGFQISTGDVLLLGCALMFAVQITFVDQFAPKVDPLRLNTIQALVCAVLSTGVMLTGEPQPSWDGVKECALPLIHTGIFSMGIAYGLQIIGQKDLEPTAASLIMSLESVFAALFGALLLQERMADRELLGCALVFCAVILSQIPIKIKNKVH